MKQRGRTSLVTIAGLASLTLVAWVLLMAKGRASTATSQFMDALLSEDAQKLADLSYMPGEPREKIKAEWEKTIRANRYYQFGWRLTNERELSDTRAVVVLMVTRNAASPEANPEKAEIPMIKVDGRWLVPVRELPRNLYPALPR